MKLIYRDRVQRNLLQLMIITRCDTDRNELATDGYYAYMAETSGCTFFVDLPTLVSDATVPSEPLA